MSCGRRAIAMQALEVRAHIGGALIAEIALLLERLVNDALELRREFRIQANGRRRNLIENGIEYCRRSGSLESHVARGHFVEHHAKRKKIGARIQLFTKRLLRTH